MLFNRKSETNKEDFFTGPFVISIFFLTWELAVRNDILNPLYVGTPSNIFKEGIAMINEGGLVQHLTSSIFAFFVGFLVAIFVGVIGGLLIGTNKKIYKILMPFIFAINSAPPIVLLPIIIIWLGIGTVAKIFIIFLMAFVPVLVNAADSVSTTDENLLKMARSYGAKKISILKTITFFNALPSIMAGVKVGVGRALVGVIVAEFFGIGKGVGYLISYYGYTFNTDRAMFLVIIVVTFSILVVNLVNLFDRRIDVIINQVDGEIK